jgi:hypothetical protein
MRLPAESLDPAYQSELDAMLADLDLADLGRHWEPTVPVGRSE